MQAATEPKDMTQAAEAAQCKATLADGVGFNPSSAALAERDRCEALVGNPPGYGIAPRGVADDLVSALMFLLFAAILAALVKNTVPRDAA